MTDKPAAQPRPRMGFVTILTFVAAFYVLLNAELRTAIGDYAGIVLDPLLGFDYRYPVLTLMLAGALVVVVTTLFRHFTTDWLEMAKVQAYIRHFSQERMKATKENNTYKLKALNDRMDEVRAMQQKMSGAQMKQMPVTMLISFPIFFWLVEFIQQLPYTYFAEPWNPQVDMFGFTVLPHWVLLQLAMTIPFGFLVQRVMKYFAWRERWQGKHPGVHE